MANFDPQDPYAAERQNWRAVRRTKHFGRCTAEMEARANAFERIIAELCLNGMGYKEIARLVGITYANVGDIWRRSEMYVPGIHRHHTTKQDPTAPSDAQYYPEPGGSGFVMTPAQYNRLTQIRALKRLYGSNSQGYMPLLRELEKRDSKWVQGDWGQWV